MDNLDIHLNLRDKKTISAQLQEELRRLIQIGAIPPGSQLPTVRELAARLQVNFNTVARVYRLLDQEGIVSTHQGRGSYLIEKTGDTAGEGKQKREESIDRFINAVIEKANQIGISPQQFLALLRQRMLPDDSGISAKPHKRRSLVNKKHLAASPRVQAARQAVPRIGPQASRRKRRRSMP